MPQWESFIQFIQAAQQVEPEQRQALVDELLQDRQAFPWIERDRATFVYLSDEAQSVALNMDIIENDPPFAEMVRLEGTNLWYVQRVFERDDLLDYLIAVDDPMTPLQQEKDIVGRINTHWRTDTHNPVKMSTTQMEVSVLRMPQARPMPDWAAMKGVVRGDIYEHEFDSVQMGFQGRKVWVYTPPGYDDEPNREYPMMVLLDGQWMVGPLQVPYIADALIKHGRMEPVIIAMKQSGTQANRIKDYVSNDKHYAALLTELLPMLQSEYRIDATNLGLGGVGVGAIGAAHAALKNPAVFDHLIMLSPPLGKGPGQEKLLEYADRFNNARLLPQNIFQSVGRYEMKTRFYKPGLALAGILQRRMESKQDVNHKFVELGSGHGLVAFKSILPEAMSHIFPGQG